MKRNKKFFYFGLGAASAIGILFIITNLFFVSNPAVLLADLIDFPQGYKIIAPQIPDNLSFAGEYVPMDDFEVRERIEREFITNTYWHSYTILAIKRASRWFPVIEPILKKNGIPDDFKYLCVAESNLSNVISPAGATGFWQFMKETAKIYNLEVNDEVDERYDVIKSTEAACKYLLDAKIRFGRWTVAAASYNMGMNGIEKQTARQKTDNYYNMTLGDETSRYIARIIALKFIMENPAKYGYDIKSEDLYAPLEWDYVTISGPVDDLAGYAISKEINYKLLKYYNPWLRDNKLTNKNNRIYSVKIPKKGSIEIIKD